MNTRTTTWCKICGVTSLDDALVAATAGVDAIGFNFFEASPRYIDPNGAAEICVELQSRHPEVKRIGLFVNASTLSLIHI